MVDKTSERLNPFTGEPLPKNSSWNPARERIKAIVKGQINVPEDKRYTSEEVDKAKKDRKIQVFKNILDEAKKD